MLKNRFGNIFSYLYKSRLLNAILLILIGIILFSLFFVRKDSPQTIKQIKELLSYLSLGSLQISFFFILTIVITSFKEIRQFYEQIPKKLKILLAIILFNSILLAYFVAPNSNRIYFDEHIYQSIGKSIAYNGKAVFANYADLKNKDFNVIEYEFNKEPNGFPFYLSIFFKIFGATENVANNANIFAFVLSVLSIFLISILTTNSYSIGLFASLTFSTIPISVLWSNTASSEICTALLGLLSFLTTIVLCKWPSIKNYLLTSFILALAFNFRPESFMILLPCLIYILLNKFEILKDYKIIPTLSLLVLLTAPLFAHIILVRHEPWGSSGSKFAIAYFFDNIKVNLPFYFTNIKFPLIYTLFAIYGLLNRSFFKYTLPLFIWFLLFWGIFLFFYAGSYEFGSDIRFSILSYAPLSLMAGIGIHKIRETLANTLILKNYSSYITITLFLLLNIISFLPYMRTLDGKSYLARNDVDFITSTLDIVPSDAIVLSHVPSVWFMKERSSILLSTLKSNLNRVKNDFPKIFNGGVYIHFGSWCLFKNPTQQEFCNFALSSLPLKLIKETNYGSSSYKLYKYEPENKN